MSEQYISSEALAVLRDSTLAEDRVAIPQTRLDPVLYEEVNEVLNRLGGKWKGGRCEAHLFPYDPRPLLQGVLESGIMPPKNPTAFFPTPPDLIKCILASSLFEQIEDEARILEPSAGFGAFALALRRRFAHRDVTIDCCEILPINQHVLRSKSFPVVAEDFLSYAPTHKYHAVVMNPPFSLPGDPLAYITHILHAWELLADNGFLIAITPNGYTFRSDKKSYDFLSLVLTYGRYEKNPPGSFRASETNVETTTIYLEKTDLSWRFHPHQGCPSWYCWNAMMAAEHNGAHFHECRRQLFDRLSQRELVADLAHPATCRAIRDYYEEVVKEARCTGFHLELREEDYCFMEQSLLNDWRNECEEPEDGGASTALVEGADEKHQPAGAKRSSSVYTSPGASSYAVSGSNGEKRARGEGEQPVIQRHLRRY